MGLRNLKKICALVMMCYAWGLLVLLGNQQWSHTDYENLVFFSQSNTTSNYRDIVQVPNAALLPHKNPVDIVISTKKDTTANQVETSTNSFTPTTSHSVVLPNPLYKVYIPTFNVQEENCMGNTTIVKLSHIRTSKDVWQSVQANNLDFIIFSAHFDKRELDNRGIVKMMIFSVDTNRKYPACQLWYSGKSVTELAAVVEVEKTINIGEAHGLRYKPVLLSCAVPKNGGIPDFVSLSHKKCSKPENLIPVQYNVLKSGERKKEFSVCVTPFSLNYNQAHELIEFIEINKILGAEHFTFYNHTNSPNIRKVIETYKDLIKVVPWPIPLVTDSVPPPPRQKKVEVHYFGQLAALNDCLYRNMYRSKYILFADLDEVATPRTLNSWSELLNYAHRQYPAAKGIAEYVFRNTFFKKEWADDEIASKNETIRRYRLSTLLKTKNENKIARPGTRSKFMVNPLNVLAVCVHKACKRKVRTKTYVFPEHVALVHHYRDWDNPHSGNWTVDRNMYRFADKLLSNVGEMYKKLPELLP